MAGLFSPSNTDAQDDAVATAVAGSIRLTLERLTPGQVKAILSRINYCPNCGTVIKDSENGEKHLMYLPEEWLAGRWEPIGICDCELNRPIEIARSIHRISSNTVRVISPCTSQVYWYSPARNYSRYSSNSIPESAELCVLVGEMRKRIDRERDELLLAGRIVCEDDLSMVVIPEKDDKGSPHGS
jgi:hypothetical protein